jgi:hypothetical protein
MPTAAVADLFQQTIKKKNKKKYFFVCCCCCVERDTYRAYQKLYTHTRLAAAAVSFIRGCMCVYSNEEYLKKKKKKKDSA